MRRQRNNVSRMTWEHRRIVCRMLVDGATYADIRTALHEAGEPLEAHDRSLQAYSRSTEYREYAERARGYRDELERDRLEAAALNDGRGPESSADLITMDVLRALRDLTAAGSVKDLDGLASVTRAVAPILRNQVAQQKLDNDGRLERLKSDHAERLAELQAELDAERAEIARLRKQIERLSEEREAAAGEVDPARRAEVIDAVNDFVRGQRN